MKIFLKNKNREIVNYIAIEGRGGLMTSLEKNDLFRKFDLKNCDVSNIIDLREIVIDTSKSLSDRVNSFFSNIDNPYLFKVDDVIVSVDYCGEKSFFDVMLKILS